MNQSKLKYKNLIIIGLIIFISIGFAYLTSSLQIFGTGHLKKTTWNIFFDNVQILQGNNLVENRPTTSADHTTTTLDYSVNFETPGDVFQFDVDIVNESTLDAMITVLNQSTNNDTDQDFFTYSIKYVDGSSLNKNELLKKKSFETIRVTVTYRKDINVEDLLEQEETVNFSLQLEYQQAKDANERENNMIVEDLSGNGNYAKVYGSTLNEDGTITLDGIDDYINLGKIDFDNNFTIIIRTKFESAQLNSTGAIISNAEGSGGGIFLRTTKKIDGVWYNSGVKGYSYAYSNDLVNEKQWYTLALTADNQNVKLYINGEEAGTASTGGNLVNSNEPITVGAEYNGKTLVEFINLTVSNILIYDKALTAEEIQTKYSSNISDTINENLIRNYYFLK